MSWHYIDTASAVWTHVASQSNQLQIDNATEMWNYFRSLNYSEQATAAIMGNAQHESALNPAQWQYGGYVGDMQDGYGLFQWDDASRYITTYCGHYGYDRTDGYYQCVWVETQTIGGLEGNQWIPKPGVNPASWDDFKISTMSPADLAYTFCRNWERGNWEQRRADNAQYWYQYFTGTPPAPPTPTPGDDSYAAWFAVFKLLAKRRTQVYIYSKRKGGGLFK